MPFDIDPVYVIYLVRGAGRRPVRRRHLSAVLQHAVVSQERQPPPASCWTNQPDRESVLVQLRRERGLSATGDYRLPLVALNRLILQSGLTLGIGKFAIYVGVLALFAFGLVMATRDDLLQAFGAALFCCTLLPLLRAQVQARPAAEEIRRAIPRRARHHRAQPARRPSGADRHQHGGARDGRPGRQRVRHRRRRDHLRRRSRNRHAQSVFPHRPGRPAAVRHRGGDPELDRRQPRRNPGEPFRRDPPALQDAPQDPRARLRRPRLGDDPVVAADRHVPGDPGHHAGLLRQRLARGPDQDLPRRAPAAGCGSAISSCSAWSISGSDDGRARPAAERRQHHPGRGAGVPRRRRRWRSASWRSMRVQGSVKRRAANIGRIGDVGAAPRRHPLAAAFEPEGRAARHRIHHQALFGRQHRRDQGAAPPDGPGRHLRSARGRPISFSAAPRWRSAWRRCCSSSCRREHGGAGVLAVDRLRRHRRLSRAEPLHRQAHQEAEGRAPAPASRISWTCWWCAPTPASAWRRRSIASAASSAIPIRRSPPTCTWPTWKYAPAAP